MSSNPLSYSMESPLDDMEKELLDILAQVGRLQELVEEQSSDEDLWYTPQTIAEVYLQAALRRVHSESRDIQPLKIENLEKSRARNLKLELDCHTKDAFYGHYIQELEEELSLYRKGICSYCKSRFLFKNFS